MASLLASKSHLKVLVELIFSVKIVYFILISGGTDGASVNTAEQNGMKGKMQQELPWLFGGFVLCPQIRIGLQGILR